jgi:hypothetical protein
MFFQLDELGQINSFDLTDMSKIHKNITPISLYFDLQQKDILIELKCMNIVYGYKNLLIHLTWENLFYLGTDEQRRMFNSFRLEYVKLLKKHLNCVDSNCDLIEIGTSTNISYVSDIDMNISLNFKTTSLDKVLDRITYILTETHKYHFKHFNDSMDIMFDINIYASEFKINKKIISNQDQHIWAFIRIIELCEKNTSYTKIARKFIKKIIPDLYDKTLEKYNDILQKKTNYINSLTIYYKNSVNDPNNIEKLIEDFSQSKFYEKETYRSVGAYLHIVGGKTDLDISLYYDSILDNYGFLIDNLLHNTECSKIDLTVKLLRVAKYFDRICQAMQFAKKNNEKIDKFKNICLILNNLRKQLMNNPEVVKEIKNKLFELKILFITKEETEEEAASLRTVEWWFKSITRLIFKEFLPSFI